MSNEQTPEETQDVQESLGLSDPAAGDPFYITGGTLPLDADSYVVRRADVQLFDGLMRGEFCYVLNTRQMGKSSLMVRAARRLREEGCQVALLDLTAIGQNLTVEQWYYGLLTRTAAQTQTTAAMVAFWKANRELGPMQRYLEAIRHVLLEGASEAAAEVTATTPTAVPAPPREGREGRPDRASRTGGGGCDRLIIFVDEIDVVRSLPFSVDEFFAGIRECYNRRPQDPVFERLTFCLLGVAAPSDLVQDTRISPFNIGTRIELGDFTPDEAARLAQGLLPHRGIDDNAPSAQVAQRLLRRVLYWTGGHPYMTQRLCQAVAQDTRDMQGTQGRRGPFVAELLSGEQRVDRPCRELFLTKRAREADDNLTFVRNRLLHSEVDTSALLDLYRAVRRHRRGIDNDAANPLCSLLQLSGVAAVSPDQRDRLVCRNRIYDQVFDNAWIDEHLPGAELRRQRAAFRRGVWRTATAGGIALIVVGALALVAVRQAQIAHQQTGAARRAEKRASEQEGIVRAQLSQKYVETAVRLMNAGDYGAALSPVAAAANLDKDDPDRLAVHQRWFAFLAAATPRIEKFWSATRPVNWATFSPDRKWVAAGGEDGVAHLWETTTGTELPLQTPPGAKGTITDSIASAITGGAFSPDGTRLIVCGAGVAAPIWDVKTRKLLGTIPTPPHGADGPRGTTVSWSQDGQQIATARGEQATVWRVAGAAGASFATPRFVMTDNTPNAFLNEAVFSPDGKSLAVAYDNSSAWVLALPHDKPQFRIGSTKLGNMYHATHTVWSRDGKRLLISGAFVPKGKLEIRGAGVFEGKQNVGEHLGREVLPLLPHSQFATWAVFSPDETHIATASEDGTARVWSAQTGQPVTPPLLQDKDKAVSRVTFSPSGRRIATASVDGTARVWDAATGAAVCAPLHHAGAVVTVQFQDDDHLLTASRDGTVRVWNIAPPAPFLHLDDISKLSLFDNDTYLLTALYIRTPKYPAISEDRLYDFTTGRLQFSCSGVVREVDDSPRFVTNIVLSAPRKKDNPPNSVRVWDAQVARFVSPPLSADWGTLSHDGQAILLHEESGLFQLCDVGTGKPLFPSVPGAVQPDDGFSGKTDVLGAAFFTPDDQYFLLCPTLTTLRFFDRRTGQPHGAAMPHDTPLRGWNFSPDGRYLATASTTGDCRLWNVPDGTPASSSYPLDNGGWNRVFSPNGRFLLSTGQQGIYFWPLDSGVSNRPDRLITPQTVPLQGLTDFVISPDSASFVALGQTAWLWHVGAQGPMAVDTKDTSKVIYAAFSPDSRRVFVVREDGSALFYDAQTARPLTPQLAQTQIDQIIFSPDGKWLATGSQEGIVRLWDTRTGEPVSPPLALKWSINRLFFSKDGRRLLAFAYPEAWRGEGVVWELPQVSDDAATMAARAQLLSGQTEEGHTEDTQVESAPLDAAALRAAWLRIGKGAK